ncbi:hypothetical protein CVIRNUC_001497 [Coccomyxa viridis]|uniref:J domain-containing protein n=1 Tax=Coccomyxa viridis TaxID=1274662 RepID=A0AAV1HV06_9CHLO|nr:hypothetical protein CVIRNUC_001497 [Coccomyxa viridis]
MPERAAAATASVDMPGWSACSGKQTVSEGSAVIATVAGQIQAKDYAAALAMLEAHHEDSVHGDLQLILQICYRAQQEQWWQVLQLEPGSDAKSIKATVRTLARKVHPDKCSLPGGAEAFKAVIEAAEHVSTSDTEKAQYRDNGAQWWAEWDDPEQQSRKRKAEALQEQHGEARRIWWAQLQDLPLQDLQEEVRKLQRDILKDQDVPKAERQERLREARALLNQRLSEDLLAARTHDLDRHPGGGFFA